MSGAGIDLGRSDVASLSDRERQDEVIRYLADARVRQSHTHTAPIAAEEAEKAGKFARFLARRYYRDRLHRSCRYSFLIAPQAAAEQVVDSAEFDAFLDQCALGSLESAVVVRDLALQRLGEIAAPGAWWREVLVYQGAFFLQAATSGRGDAKEMPRRGHSAVCLDFDWAIPQVLDRLKRGAAVDDSLRRPATLVFSRTAEGRIYVMEADAAAAAVFKALKPGIDVERIAGIPATVARETLASLAAIGAAVIDPVTR